MSETTNAKVAKSEAASFSRRRVVKGVAWSVPVIVTAIAAPAAAASVVAASVTLGAATAVTLAGVAPASGTALSGFDIQTGSAFAGTSVSYTVQITAQKDSQKALIAIASVSPDTGTTTIPQNKKHTSFAGTLSTTPGNHKLPVSFTGYKYSETATKGTFTYDVILTVTLAGSPAIVTTTTLSVTFP